MFWNRSKFTVREIVEQFLKANTNRWKNNPEEKQSTADRYRFVTNRYLLPIYGDWNADKFRRTQLRGIRDRMIEEGNLCKRGQKKAQTTINTQIKIIFLIFEWAANKDWITDDTLISLAHLRPLRIGDDGVLAPRKIVSVPEQDVMSVVKIMKEPLGDMVQTHWLTGMRSSEVCHLRKCDIVIEDNGLWRYQPYTHKTETKGKERVIFLGPKCQAILQKYCDESTDEEFLFSPTKTMEYIYKNAKTRIPMNRKFKDHYIASAYYYAVRSAVIKAGVPYWHPHQLRHSFATIVTNQYGAESAKESLGHSTIKTTEIYIDPSYDRARRIAKELS